VLGLGLRGIGLIVEAGVFVYIRAAKELRVPCVRRCVVQVRDTLPHSNRYGVATISRLRKIIGFLCKRAL